MIDLLTNVGRMTRREMGKLLRKENLIPDVIISSTALRAHTAKAVAKACGYRVEAMLNRSLMHLDRKYIFKSFPASYPIIITQDIDSWPQS
jgi:phosphohistidine phosphatase SixA